MDYSDKLLWLEVNARALTLASMCFYTSQQHVPNQYLAKHYKGEVKTLLDNAKLLASHFALREAVIIAEASINPDLGNSISHKFDKVFTLGSAPSA